MMRSDPSWSFLIVAAGSGSRLGGEPKQFRTLGGRRVWEWSVRIAEQLWQAGMIRDLVIVVPAPYVEKIKHGNKLKMPLIVTEGGAIRTESVLNGLKKCSGSHVLVHDGARPFISTGLCTRLMEAASRQGCAVPVLPISDSLRKQDAQERTRAVDRKDYFTVQTPQAFDREKLIDILGRSETGATDEATLWEQAGLPFAVLPGEKRNFKITDPFDWEAASALISRQKEIRTGHGYDVHQLVPGRKLILAGIEIENGGIGLLGHSDADIITHTVMDAILGAAGEPDIGTLFPAANEKWKDADSVSLLKEVIGRVRLQGWAIDWVDVTIEAQTPRLGHRIEDFIEHLHPVLCERADKRNFNVKAKSGEGCGSVGRGECMICHGVATLSRDRAAED